MGLPDFPVHFAVRNREKLPPNTLPELLQPQALTTYVKEFPSTQSPNEFFQALFTLCGLAARASKIEDNSDGIWNRREGRIQAFSVLTSKKDCSLHGKNAELVGANNFRQIVHLLRHGGNLGRVDANANPQILQVFISDPEGTNFA